jgi:hypothetical protein
MRLGGIQSMSGSNNGIYTYVKDTVLRLMYSREPDMLRHLSKVYPTLQRRRTINVGSETGSPD